MPLLDHFHPPRSRTTVSFRVLVADVTHDEWQRIQSDVGLLPNGWSLEENRFVQRVR